MSAPFFNSNQANDDDVFVFNPLYRLCNRSNHVVAYGYQGIGTWHFDRISAIALALCNGKRTVAEIAQCMRSFSNIENDTTALDSTKRRIKPFLLAKTLTKEELRGQSAPDNRPYPESVLVTKTVFESTFKTSHIPLIEYDARAFLPKTESEITWNVKRPIHEEIPLSLNWHITSECTTDCKYCYLGRRHTKLLEREIFFERLEEAVRIGVCNIDLAGGDIICSPYLIDMLSVLKHHKLMPIMLSSKSHVSKNLARLLADVKDSILEFQFSIDSDDEQIAFYLTGMSGFPNRIFDSIVNVLETGIPVTSKIVITPYNILTVPRLYCKLKSMGVNRIRLALYSRSGFHHTDDLFNHRESCDWLAKEVEKLQKEFPEESIYVQNGTPSLKPIPAEVRKSSWKDRTLCPAGRSSMMICSDGKVIPCEQMPETDEYFCGDLTKQSIMEVWNGDKLKEMTYGMSREKFKGQPCYDCEEREECHNVMGYCIRDLAAHYGNIYQPPPNCWRHDLPFIRQT
ncbi:hypothetical protein FACS1894189_2540 [Planctomycetales bacterium]|nr:hypothetical protein FACS1894189_2540 [Planctomycetales bacterium]